MYESVQVPGVVNGVRNRPLSPRVEVEIFVTASSFDVSGYDMDSKEVPRAGSQPMLPTLWVGPSKRQGFGLFARQDMAADTFLTEQTGEYLSHEYARKGGTTRPTHTSRHWSSTFCTSMVHYMSSSTCSGIVTVIRRVRWSMLLMIEAGAGAVCKMF